MDLKYKHQNSEIINFAKQVIQDEINAIKQIEINNNFILAVKEMLNCRGQIIFIGIGKSGDIAKKIAATFVSTGTPAIFLHATEALHGGLGIIRSHDIVFAISNSGNTIELLKLLPSIKNKKINLFAITNNKQSTLALNADIHFNLNITKEACPLNLAPTNSSTASLVLGDALAMSILKIRGFTKEQFAIFHPDGILGKKLLLKVEHIMRRDKQIPVVHENILLKDALIEMSVKSLGGLFITDNGGKLKGVFTDGDLRRCLQKINNLDLDIKNFITKNPKTIFATTLAIEALKFMQKNKILTIPVIDKKQNLIGVIHIHDILQQGLK